jgi:hypothetical protein
MIRKGGRSRVCLTGVIAIMASSASATPRHQVFSSLCREVQSDDVDGHVVAIDFHGAARSVSVSWSDGNLEAPAPADWIRFAPKTGRLSFRAPAGAGVISFDGRLSVAGLEGELRDPWETAPHHVRLPPAPPANTPLPACPTYPSKSLIRER